MTVAVYTPPTFVGYPDPVADPTDNRPGQRLDAQFFTDLTKAVAQSAPRLTRVGMVTPADGQVAQVDASSGNVTMPALPALPAGTVVGYERVDGASANVVTITDGTTPHVLRFRGHQILLTSRGGGVWDRLANWLPYDPLKALLDSQYATKAELAGHTGDTAVHGGGTGSGGGGTGGGSGTGSASAATVTPKAYDDLSAVGDGPLTGRAAPSGQTWTCTNSAAGASDPVIRGGAIGPASGHTPGGTGGTAAGYAYLQPGGTVARVGATVRFDASDSAASAATLGAFTQTGVTATAGGSNMHLGIYPWGVLFGVFAAGANELTASGYLTPDGYDPAALGSPPGVRFPTPLVCDGVTEHRVEVILDTRRSRAYVTVGDFPTLTYTDPRIRSVAATWAFWEYFSVTGGTNLPRFVKVWADPVAALDAMPQSAHLSAAQAGAGPGPGGSGPASRRPSPRMRDGSTWWDTGVPTTVSAATQAGATTFSAPVPIPVGSIVYIDTGTNQEVRTVTARSGTGPYSHTVAALGLPHASGAAVVGGPKPTWSDGQNWRDQSGVVVGNRLSINQSQASEDAGGLVVSQGAPTIARSRPPVARWRDGACYKVTATAAGALAVYVSFVNAEPGTPFFTGIAQALAATNARSAKITTTFYDANFAIPNSRDSATVTIPTGATPTELLLAPAVVAGAGTTAMLGLLTISAVAVGDVFYLGGWTYAPGAVASHQRA